MSPGNGLVQLTAKDFKSDQEVRWCPGCGDYAILAGVQSFLPGSGSARESCSCPASAAPRAFRTTCRRTGCTRSAAVRRRSRPGRDLAPRPVGLGGDGGRRRALDRRQPPDPRAATQRRHHHPPLQQPDLRADRGRYSPTSELGKVTKSTPLGSVDQPFNPLSIAIGRSDVRRPGDRHRQAGLRRVLRAAAAHPGRGVRRDPPELPNIYNDGAFDVVRDEKENRLYLRAGEEIRWGDKGVRMRPDGTLEIVDASVGGLLRHDPLRDDPGLAFALARLTWESAGAVPLVFRSVTRPVYEDLVHEQVRTSVEKRGEVTWRPCSTARTPGRSASAGRAALGARRARSRRVAPRLPGSR